ncbi:MAG: DEAD/DEAH box helicase family protein [Tepidisphaeraceae bacterium]
MSDLEGFSVKPRKRSTLVDPIQIFESLTLRGSIKDIWGSQKDALKDWHEHRDAPDTQFDMTTGGGKTLVGLLAAQSLVNETRGKILYVCPTNQLVEQAARRAAECGISVATYSDGTWTDRDVFDDARGACVTNYHALFHPWSKFQSMDVSGIIFDDAHVAGNTIRSQFTLRIPRNHKAFEPLWKLFAPYFARAGLTNRLAEATSGNWRALLFVPLFEVWPAAAKLASILIDSGVEHEDKTKYNWEHLKDHLDRCVILISGMGIEIAPPVLPLHRMRYFQPGVRRIYLTATVPSPSEFIRAFGVSNARRIQPGGKAGDAQRQFLFMYGDEDVQRKEARELVKDRKACIITPSGRATEPWKDFGKIFDGEIGHTEIERFSASKTPEKLILIARYDGVDLPGDACRILILDRVPAGTGLFDRFIDESLSIEPLRRMRTATRIMQSIGRIFRSNTDHGAVLVCGTDLQQWLRDPKNQAYLPGLIQRQVQLGTELRKAVDEGRITCTSLLDGVLSGSKEWDRIYKSSIEDFDITAAPVPPAWLADVAIREQAAYRKLWEGDFAGAAADYAAVAEFALPHDARLAAWFRHWEGRCLERQKDTAGALKAYTDAANTRSELGRPKIAAGAGIVSAAAPVPGKQAERIAVGFDKRRAKTIAQLKTIQERLVNGPDTKPAEAAMHELGELLGMVSTRPDTASEDGTGPDVLWRYPEKSEGAALELKTDKKAVSKYTKKEDIGQFQDHVNYLAKKHPDEDFRLRIVGPRVPVSPESNPPDDLRISEVEQFQGVAQRTETFYQLLVNSDGNESTAVTAERWLNHFGLDWPNVVDSLESDLATDLQSLPPDEAK